MKKNVVILAGGTGGHISPGIALAECLVARKESMQIGEVYIHSLVRNADNPDLSTAPCTILWHRTPIFERKKILIYPFLMVFHSILNIVQLKKLKIDFVISMGGYSTIPGVLYAILFRKKLYICEQNRIIGKVNRIFGRFADKMAFSFPPMGVSLIPSKMQVCGNPIRKRIIPIKIVKAKIRTSEAVRKGKLNVLVMGGSQGARQINNIVISLLEDTEIEKSFQFRMLTGTSLYEETKKKTLGTTELISYSNEMNEHYQWADIIIARSGAGVCAECTIFALPMILIPYPFAADNHQEENARYFEEQKAAWVVIQKGEEPNLVIDILKNIKKNPNLLNEYSNNSLRCASPDAALATIEYFFGNV